ncbi:MAG TPA: cupin domain-containing protein [Pyrinomonadaceae bacterium]|nr:cupin domain-containing protein [Pyrinomonadaceae bacterium]
MKLSLRIFGGVIGVIFLYLIFGIVIDSYVFSPPKPDLTGYFQPGDRFVSRFEGFEQTVLAVNGGHLHTRLEVKPHAVGPPEHFHENFTETFTVKSGTLSILVNGEKRSLKAGETLAVPPMTKHKPFNETGETVIVESDDPRTLPIEFGFLLTQLYGFMDQYPNGPSTPQMLMQLSVYGEDADSYVAEGPSLSMQKAMRVVMAPTARLLGYKYHYPEFKPIRN